MSHHDSSIQDWLVSNRVYEQSLFVYFLICLAWFLVGRFTLGFHFSGLSGGQNLFLNFIWFGLLSIALCTPKFWYYLVFNVDGHLFYQEQQILDEIDDMDLNDEEKLYITQAVASSGGMTMSFWERWCLGFLFCCLLFDILYVKAWVHDAVLIWQPNWLLSCTTWVKDNLATPPLYQNWQLFTLYFSDSDIELKKIFSDEHGLLNSSFANTLLFYHFVKTMIFIPVLIALSIVLWKPLRWLGLDKIDPRHADSLISFLRACAWLLVIGFFTILAFYFLVNNVDTFALFLIDFSYWLSQIKLNFLSVFIVIGIRFFYGWFAFWKQILFNH